MRYLLILGLINLSSTVCAWGDIGHKIVAQLAYEALDLNVKSSLFPSSQIEDVEERALWADKVKKTEEYSWSAHLHYVNVHSDQCM